MLDFTPQYAPDLEWMLQSGQVPRDLLLEALLQEYYARVYHLALSILDDRTAAQSAASQTFARALLDQHRYRSQDGVEFWLFRIALEACQPFQKRLKFRRSIKAALPRMSKPDDFGDSCPETLQDAGLWLALDSLEEHARQLALLHFANGWQPDRIAALFEVAESDVEAVLAAARQLVAQASPLDDSLPSDDPLPPEQLDPCLVQSLQRRWPDQQFSPAELEAQASVILRRLRWLGFRQTKALAALEIGLMVLIILLAFASIWGANLLFGAGPAPTESGALPTYLVTRLVTQLVTATPLPQPSSVATSIRLQIAKSNYTEVKPGETLTDVANRLGVTVEDLQYWNRLPNYVEVQAGNRLINPQYARSLKPPEATPVAQAAPLPTLEASVTIPQLVDLLNKTSQSLKSYWSDASIIDYGPQSYIGPPRLTHMQAWASDNQYLLLSGSYGALPDKAILMPGDNNQLLAEPASDMPWFSEWRAMGDWNSPAMQSISQFGEALFNLSSFDQLSTPQVLGREDLAGRSTLKIDLFDPTRNHYASLWVDDSQGQILRRINYRAGAVPAMEYRINRLDANVDFPQELFDQRLPWRGSFAQDFSGAPLAPNAPPPENVPQRPILTAHPPPSAGFDPSHSPLTFQYAGSYTGFSSEAQYQVFAGRYFIGQTYFGDPWNMICDRSPDGAWIAYVSQPAQSLEQGSMLHWFDLSEPAVRFFTLHDQTGITELAFSPDTRRLAFFSRPNPSALGTLSTVSLPYQNVRTIYTTGDINSLVWSPDGKYLAFIERANPSAYQEKIMVISSTDGSISYNTPLDVLSGPVHDWPMVKWGVDFPVEKGGMDACSAPPQP